MAMFGMRKTKPTEGSELVLAYLEEAQRVRTALLAFDPMGRETPASLVRRHGGTRHPFHPGTGHG